jgi:beta-galactosidase
MVDENDRVTLGGYPGELRKLLGIWVEEYDVVKPDQPNRMVLKQPIGELTGSFKCGLLCALIHTETAEAAAVYGSDFYAGRPALTRNRFGKGTAWYAGSDPEAAMVGGSLAHICTEQGVEPILAAPPKVEVQQRKKAGQTFTFVLNHNEEAVERSGPCCRSGPAERQGTPRRSEAAGEGGVDHR